jgi:hypothetical protein
MIDRPAGGESAERQVQNRLTVLFTS